MVKILYIGAIVDEMNRLCGDALNDAIFNFEWTSLAELVSLNRLANEIFGERMLAARYRKGDRLYFRSIYGDPATEFYMKAGDGGVSWWKGDRTTVAEDRTEKFHRWTALIAVAGCLNVD